jgi:Tol biopolymer transport system component
MKTSGYSKFGLAAGVAIFATLVVVCGSGARAETTECVSVASDGTPGNATSQRPAVSGDGHCVAFESLATNLAPGITNGKSQVFVRKRQTGQTICVSVALDGSQGNNDSDTAAISGDGRFVAFHSVATNLIPGGTSGIKQVYVHDCVTGSNILVSVASGGGGGNGPSLNATITADGRYVSFNSGATDLVPGVTNGKSQVYIYDIIDNQMICASLAAGGIQGNGDSYIAYISADGSTIAFISTAQNLGTASGGQQLVYVRDLVAGTNTCVSFAPDGKTLANAACGTSSISADGRYVGFDSNASNLVTGDSNGHQDCFVRDRQMGTTTRISVSSSGAQGNSNSDSPQLRADGRFVVFESDASNLVSGDSNGQTDVFLRDLRTGQTARVSLSASGGQLNDFSWDGLSSISADGSVIAFHTDSSNVVPGIGAGNPGHVYVRILPTSDLEVLWVQLAQKCKTARGGQQCSLKGSLSVQDVGIMNTSASSVAFYLSTNSLYDASASLLSNAALKPLKAGKGGKPGQKAKVSLKVKLPANTNADGQYVIAVVGATQDNNTAVFGPIAAQ